MVEHWHGDVKVRWTDGEWERLQKIKRGEYVPEISDKPKSAIIGNLRVTDTLRDKLKVYAESKGLSVQEFVRVALNILAE